MLQVKICFGARHAIDYKPCRSTQNYIAEQAIYTLRSDSYVFGNVLQGTFMYISVGFVVYLSSSHLICADPAKHSRSL